MYHLVKRAKMTETIGKRLRHIREELRLSQQGLGDKIGISKQAVSNVENSLSNPSVDVMSKLFLYLKVDLNYLITGKGEPFLNETDDFDEKLKTRIQQEVTAILKSKGIE